MIPMMTPSAVSSDRILCIRICSAAMRKLSRISTNNPYIYGLSLFLDGHFRAVFEAAADGGVTAGDHFLAGLHAILDLDVGRVGDPRLDFGASRPSHLLDEDDALQFLPLLARLLLSPGSRW